MVLQKRIDDNKPKQKQVEKLVSEMLDQKPNEVVKQAEVAQIKLEKTLDKLNDEQSAKKKRTKNITLDDLKMNMEHQKHSLIDEYKDNLIRHNLIFKEGSKNGIITNFTTTYEAEEGKPEYINVDAGKLHKNIGAFLEDRESKGKKSKDEVFEKLNSLKNKLGEHLKLIDNVNDIEAADRIKATKQTGLIRDNFKISGYNDKLTENIKRQKN
ncbi:hypothetical protein BGC07_14455 [Piscirickettsia litoralis]|uniref:Uncharacterized protein n=2 Tax=Piscirickettsia litoralis TaxID=1891921 RepID=A0ABX3A5G5_9GAMM|nr:hypothetical protein BGC07_14455 [Piscirickettsia litoralis]